MANHENAALDEEELEEDEEDEDEAAAVVAAADVARAGTAHGHEHEDDDEEDDDDDEDDEDEEFHDADSNISHENNHHRHSLHGSSVAAAHMHGPAIAITSPEQIRIMDRSTTPTQMDYFSSSPPMRSTPIHSPFHSPLLLTPRATGAGVGGSSLLGSPRPVLSHRASRSMIDLLPPSSSALDHHHLESPLASSKTGASFVTALSSPLSAGAATGAAGAGMGAGFLPPSTPMSPPPPFSAGISIGVDSGLLTPRAGPSGSTQIAGTGASGQSPTTKTTLGAPQKTPTLRRQRSMPSYQHPAADPPPYPFLDVGLGLGGGVSLNKIYQQQQQQRRLGAGASSSLRPGSGIIGPTGLRMGPLTPDLRESPPSALDGQESLPGYSCHPTVQLVAEMPRKMEFVAPGKQGNDKSYFFSFLFLRV
jgi:hypothetical protein